ncbi:hypothetical protein BDW72DRAFT_199744 [Aspergillus terricola var. indicus]
MRVSALAAFSIGAVFSGIQYCPAPFLALAGPLAISGATAAAADGALASMAGGAIAGGIGQIEKRTLKGWRSWKRFDLPAGVSQESFQQCQDQLGTTGTVQLSGLEPDGVRVDNVPPACMNLATVITGNPTQEGGAMPIVMGSASLEYHGLTQDELAQLGEALKANGIIE